MVYKFAFIAALIQTASSTLLDPANLPLSGKGSKIVDNKGNPVRLSCVNWYGAHMERYVANGLDLVNVDTLA